MSFKCQKCKDITWEKTNKLTTQIRKVVYNTPCRDINDYNNSDKITTGFEIVQEINCCKKCFKEHAEDKPEIIGSEKQVYVKKNKLKRERKEKRPRNDRRDNRDDDSYNEEIEVPEKYDIELKETK